MSFIKNLKLSEISKSNRNFFVKKLKSPEMINYNKYLDNFYNSSSNYFKIRYQNMPVIIGKKFDPNGKFNKIELKSIKIKSKKKKIKDRNNLLKSSFSTKSFTTITLFNKNEPKLKKNQKIINDQEIDNIFNEFKKKHCKYLSELKNNKIKYNNNKTFNLLNSQETSLILVKKLKNKINKGEEKICEKIKKEKNKLLMLKTEGFNFKKLIKQKIANNLNEKFNWENSLRKNNNNLKIIINKEPEDYFLNTNYFDIINEETNKLKKELKLYNNNLNHNIFKKLNHIQRNFSDLKIKGKNLLNFEYDLNKNLKGKKILNILSDDINNDKLKDQLYATHF